MPPLHLDHVAHACHDVATTHRVDTDALSLPLTLALLVGDTLLAAFALADGRYLVIQIATGPRVIEPSRDHHVGLNVADAVGLAAWKARLAAHAIAVRVEDTGDAERVYLTDPNGVVLEIEIGHVGGQPSGDPGATVAIWIAAHPAR